MTLTLANLLDQIGRSLEMGDVSTASRLTRSGLFQWPDCGALWNLFGVVMLANGKTAHALLAFRRATNFDPSNLEPLRNRARTQHAVGDWAELEKSADELIAREPADPASYVLGGIAESRLGRHIAAAASFRKAVSLDPSLIDAWVALISILARDRPEEAKEAISTAFRANPSDKRLAEAWLEVALNRLKDGQIQGWLTGCTEGSELQYLHDAVLTALDAGIPPSSLPWTVSPFLMRLLAHGVINRLGSFHQLGRRWAESGDHRAMLMQIPRAQGTREDRLELLNQHRLWGLRAESAAAAAPIIHERGARGDKIRLGFMSSDIRKHVVGALSWPLFQHIDQDRFDIYIYSFFPGAADELQEAISARVNAYRHTPGVDTKRAAEIIARDDLDVLIEIGGPTGTNKIEIMGYRLAPIQMSWLGYPHSVGLKTIDYIILDPHLVPPDPALLIESPILMPESWIAMDSSYFRDEPAPSRETPESRNGFITFGSANSPYKYSPACLDAWGRILAAVPESKFLIVRPEGDSPTFRESIFEAFSAHQVVKERVMFEVRRGNHLACYNEMDISLDTMPLTGGITTCESLWMGTPVVSLAGEALYERLSFSILSNAGLGDLAVWSVQDYVKTAVKLAADRQRREDIRSGVRERIRSGPLGQSDRFAKDFYDLVARAMTAHLNQNEPLMAK